MKRIYHFNTAIDKLLHIETEGAIVNIEILTGDDGKPVTGIEVIADRYVGEEWKLNTVIPDKPDEYQYIRVMKTKRR